MKKITAIIAFVGLGILMSANAQIRLDNAKTYASQKKQYYDKAKIEIDAACEDEATKSNPEVWAWKGYIYCCLGNSTKPKHQKVTPENWADIAYEAALKCKELNTDKDAKLIDFNNAVFKNVAGKYIDDAFTDYENAGNKDDTNLYRSCIAKVEKGIKVYQAAGASNDQEIKKSLNYARYIGGAAARVLGDNETVIKFFNPLVRGGYDKEYVYTSLVTIYQRKNDTVNAVKVAQNFTKNRKDDQNAYLLAAKVYAWANNKEKANENAQVAVAKAAAIDDPNQKANLICGIADVYADMLDYETAEARFNEALTMTPDNPVVYNGLARMEFNHGVDILLKANDVPVEDETGLYDKLTAEGKSKYEKAIEYYKKSLSVNNRSNEQLQARYKEAFDGLKTVYVRANKNLDELKAYAQ